MFVISTRRRAAPPAISCCWTLPWRTSSYTAHFSNTFFIQTFVFQFKPQAPGASRDILLLDIALENWFRTCVERVQLSNLKGDDLIELAALALRGTLVSSDDVELQQCLALWDGLRNRERCDSLFSMSAPAFRSSS